MFPDSLPDQLPYASLLWAVLGLGLLTGVALIGALLVFRRFARLQYQYDALSLRHQRAEEQIQKFWKKEE